MKHGEGLVHNQSTNKNFTITSSRNSLSFPGIFAFGVDDWIVRSLYLVTGILSQNTITRTDVVLN